jgi:hypothetical protein
MLLLRAVIASGSALLELSHDRFVDVANHELCHVPITSALLAMLAVALARQTPNVFVGVRWARGAGDVSVRRAGQFALAPVRVQARVVRERKSHCACAAQADDSRRVSTISSRTLSSSDSTSAPRSPLGDRHPRQAGAAQNTPPRLSVQWAHKLAESAEFHRFPARRHQAVPLKDGHYRLDSEAGFLLELPFEIPMKKQLLAAIVLVLSLPILASAAEITFTTTPDDGDGSFSAAGASGHDVIGADGFAFVDGLPVFLEIQLGPFNYDRLKLSLTWDVGPLQSFVPGAEPDFGTWTYGPGQLVVDGHWASHEEPGIFVAPIVGLVIELDHFGSFGIGGTVRANLGPGLFQDSLAHVLGVSTHTFGGTYGIDTDGAYFSHGVGYGLGDNYGPGLAIDAAVPEPALMLTMGLGLLGIAARRRATRRRE